MFHMIRNQKRFIKGIYEGKGKLVRSLQVLENCRNKVENK